MGVHEHEPVPADRPGRHLSTRGMVTAVSRNDVYSFTKPARDEIVLIAGLGVAGDVHAGVTVRHRGRVAADPDQPNLRQVHLIHSELHDELSAAGYEIPAGGLGENVTTAGIDLLALPVGTILRFGPAPATTAGPAPAREPGATPAQLPEPAFSPVGSAPVGSAPVGSAPVGSAPVGSAPVGPAGGAAAVVAAAERVTLDASSANAVAALAARLTTEQAADSLADPGGAADLSPVASTWSPTPTGQDPAGQPDAGPAPTRAPRLAIVITGLRNPCQQINHYRPGLLKRVLTREPDGTVSRRAGVMAVVLHGGPIRPGAEIHVELPTGPHLPLDRV